MKLRITKYLDEFDPETMPVDLALTNDEILNRLIEYYEADPCLFFDQATWELIREDEKVRP